MKKQWPVVRACLAAAAMGILILDTKTALAGAQKGVALCIQTVIPSLFPFFILSILLTGAITGRSFRFTESICRLFRIPHGAEGLLAAGLLGGYPVGAQCVSQAFRNGQLSGADARRMLVICNNCGPAFLFGMAAAVFNTWYVPWLLWAIQIVSCFAVARVLPAACLPVPTRRVKHLTLFQALDRSLKVMASVCGWVVLFRVVIAFLEGWCLWMLPLEMQVGISGILELSNGCFELFRIDDMGLRFILCAGILNFGGICVTLQTMAVSTPKMDRSLYFPGKILQCCISMLLAWLIKLSVFPSGHHNHTGPILVSAAVIGAVVIGFILKKSKKSSSIPERVVV